MRTQFHALRMVSGALVIASVVFGMGMRTLFVHALSMTPPTVTIDTALDADDKVASSVAIGRVFGEEGAITMIVEFDGDCAGCIDGANYLILPSGEREVTYPFTVSAGGKGTGSYASKIRFLKYTESSGGSGAYTTIQSGVTVVVYFSVVNDTVTTSTGTSSNGGSAGSGGGSGSGGTSTDDSGDKKSESKDDTGAESDSGESTDGSDESGDDTSSDTESTTNDDAGTAEGAQDAVTAPAPISVISTDGGEVVAQPVTSVSDATPIDEELSLRSFLRAGCTACDVNGDGGVTFADVVLAYVSGGLGEEVSGTPPFAPGPPMEENAVVLTLALGDMTGAYAFRAVSLTESEGDMMAVYVTLGTGPSGAYAVDTTVTFDTTTLTYAGMSTDGSVLASVDADRTGVEDGTLRIAGVDDDAFIGTNGYLATLYFTPRAKGAVRIVLEYANVYQPYGETMSPLALESLVGSVVDAQDVEMPAPTADDATPVPAAEDSVPAQGWFATLFRRFWFVLFVPAILLVCVMCARLFRLDREMYAKR